jgi:IclR family KDG regulon transcriptional repressor
MIQVVNRAIDIIEYIALNPSEAKLMGKISSDLGLNNATCANIIKTLVDRGFLKKANQEKGYLLGDKLLEISNGSFGCKELIDKANKELLNFETHLNENTLIAVLKGDKRVVIFRKSCNQLVQALTPDEKYAFDSSTGRLLISMLSEKELQNFIKIYGLPDKKIWPEAASRIKLFEQVELIKKQGYALIEDTVQITGIATPIYKGEKAIASFSIYLPSFRFNENLKLQMIKLALETSKKLSL